MKKLYTLLLLSLTTVSFGQILSDNFNYPDNALLTANGWVQTGTAVTDPIDVGASNGLTYTGYSGLTGTTAAVVGNAARLDNTGQDVNRAFTTPITSGTLYLSFLVNVTTAVDGYFVHLANGGTFPARIAVKPSANANKINFGIGNATHGYAATPTDFDLNTTYLIIVKYDVSTTGGVSLWVRSAGVPATEAAAGTAEHTVSGGGQATITSVNLRQYAATQNIIVDGLLVYTTWFGATPCPLTLGNTVTACNAVTLNIDTYNVTIPFTGGNSGTYTLSTGGVGTIGGANPSTTAAGDITISNVPEGTSFTLTVSGGCAFTRAIASPECKPVNTLPYQESFPYTAGGSLNTEQKWSLVNSGDNVTIATGNLSYPGITSSGNSITFSGDGGETRTLFTSTTTGYVYASFIVTASDITAVTNITTGTYFASFTDNTGAVTSGRIYIRKNGTQYQYGIGIASAATDWNATLHNANDIQYLVLSYDFTGNTLSLFVNPTIGGSAAPSVSVTLTTPITNLGGFLYRQDTVTATPTMIVDELRIAATPNFTLGTSSNEISGLRVYPNPVTNGTLFIDTDANAEKTVTVFDVLGKQVINTTTSNNAINVGNLNNGVYIVKITEEGKTATRKLVIK